MLKRLQSWAARLSPLARPLLAVIALVLAGIAVLMVGPESLQREMLLIPALLLFVWLVLVYAFINLFAAVPDVASSDAGLWRRLCVAMQRGFYYLFAMLMAALTVAVVVTTFQLTMAWLRSYVL